MLTVHSPLMLVLCLFIVFFFVLFLVHSFCVFTSITWIYDSSLAIDADKEDKTHKYECFSAFFRFVFICACFLCEHDTKHNAPISAQITTRILFIYHSPKYNGNERKHSPNERIHRPTHNKKILAHRGHAQPTPAPVSTGLECVFLHFVSVFFVRYERYLRVWGVYSTGPSARMFNETKIYILNLCFFSFYVVFHELFSLVLIGEWVRVWRENAFKHIYNTENAL